MKHDYNYSIALAAFDFFPVMLSALGFYLIAKSIAQLKPEITKITYLSVILIISGGVSKATWKLIVASTDINIMPLNNGLFILMAPGFTLLTYCFYQAVKQVTSVQISAKVSFLLPITIIVLFFAVAGYLALQFPDKRYGFLCLLLLVTVSNIIFIFKIVKYCLSEKLKISALLFTLNLIGIFAMSALAKGGDQSEAVQWIEEILNSFTQGSLAVAAWLMWKKVSKTQQIK